MAIRLDERHRMIGQIVDDKAATFYRLTVVLQRRVEIVAPMSGGKPIVFREAAAVRMKRILRTAVPFAERACRIAGRETRRRSSSHRDRTVRRRSKC